ncbi:MAG: protein-disulfide reductase DsbD [Pseudomonadota bacterium]
MRAIALFLLLLMALTPVAGGAQGLLDGLVGKDSVVNLGGGQVEFLDPEEAFRFVGESKNGSASLSWDIAPGYYLYKDRFKLETNPADLGARFVDLPSGEMKEDPEFGRVEIYRDQIDLRAALNPSTTGTETQELTVTYQGCAEDGICYPPIKKTLTLVADASGSRGISNKALGALGDKSPNSTLSSTNEGNIGSGSVLSADRLASELSDRSLLSTVAIFFGFGLLLSFTPCVFPMVPILSGIIVGQKGQVTTAHAFRLSLSYVIAMATTYAIVGVIAGLFGHNLQATFQQPQWIIGFSLVFVLLALSMFGFYALELPQSWQTKLDQLSRSQTGGSYLGVAVMGVLSAIIVGPCVAPPFAAALLYLSHQGSPLVGGVALFSMAMGMGALLLVAGTAAGKMVPRSGAWMEGVKHFFGVVLLGVAIWFLSRILPGPVTLALWAALLVISASFLGFFNHRTDALAGSASNATGWQTFKKGVGALAMTYGIVLIVGAAMGAHDPLKPLAPLVAVNKSQTQALSFASIKSEQDLQSAVATASKAGKMVMLDFYADWCVECKHLEKNTFGNSAVQGALTDVLLLRADVTANDKIDQALLRRFELFGPPAVLFFDESGAENRRFRVLGFLGPEKFLAHLNALKRSEATFATRAALN